MRDKIILFSWIIGLLILISVIWIAAQPVQANNLMRSVNNVFINKDNDSRRLASYIPKKSRNTNLMGYWYSMHDSTDSIFVFTVFKDGILVPLGAIVDSYGSVKEVIPLSKHSEQVFEEISQNFLKMYIRRIESASFKPSLNGGGS